MQACSKCASPKVHVIDVDFPRYGNAIPTGTFSQARIEHHVCTACGYVEMYVSDPAVREKIAENWPIVSG